MPVYIKKDGYNPEVWAEKPEGYLTMEEWEGSDKCIEEMETFEKTLCINAIKKRLEAIDLKSIRPLRDKTTDDMYELEELTKHAAKLRQELKKLNGEK